MAKSVAELAAELHATFRAYKEEMGEMYDERDFVDFVVAQVVGVDGAGGMLDFYEERSRELLQREVDAAIKRRKAGR